MKNFCQNKKLLFIPLGAVCYYLALPPLNLWLLAFLVPVFWTAAIKSENEETGFRFSYIYLTAFIFWLSSIYWISFPHPVLYLGLFALSAFLSLYWVLFFYSAKVAVHRFRIPAVIVMPVCWVGCEYLRFHLLGGFSFCALEHSFYKQPMLIQLANLGGEYAVAAWIFFTGAMFCTLFAKPQCKRRFCETFCKTTAKLALTTIPLIYGFFSGFDFDISMQFPLSNPVGIAALQGNIPLTLSTAADVSEKTFKQLVDLTYKRHEERDSVKPADPLHPANGKMPDLIIFPETTCPIPILEFTGKVKPEDVGLTKEQAADWQRQLQGFADEIQTPVLFGCSTYSFRDSETPVRLNSALYLATADFNPPLKKQLNRYDKIRLVMFGEYIPFSKYLPNNFFIKTLCQEAGRGKGYSAMPLGAGHFYVPLFAAPNICFESSVPHFIRRQITTLQNRNQKIAVIINLSNDAWFHFSRQIDQHLAANVFRAVENGVWCISATNGGFSAIIRPDGSIQNIGKRGQAEIVEGTIYPELHWNTLYQTIGDIHALLCALAVLILSNRVFRLKRLK